jgi:methylated-DNA-protein-cysteine methyltransferase-like protein
VLNAQGRISLPAGSKAHRTQRRLLEEEGVVFRNGRADLRRSRPPDLDALLWRPRPRGD